MVDSRVTLLFIVVTCFTGRLIISWNYVLRASEPSNYCETATSGCSAKIPTKAYGLSSEHVLLPSKYEDIGLAFSNETNSQTFDFMWKGLDSYSTSTPFQIDMLYQLECNLAFTAQYNLSTRTGLRRLNLLTEAILKNYQHHWVVDKMPVSWCFPVSGSGQYCIAGFPIGCYVDPQGNPKDACVISGAYNKPDTFYLFNHLDLLITYHSGGGESWGSKFGDKGGRIVVVEVIPRSINYKSEPKSQRDCAQGSPAMEINGRPPLDVVNVYHTVSVYFFKDNSRNRSWKHLETSLPEHVLKTILAASLIFASITSMLMFRTWQSGMRSNASHKTDHRCWSFLRGWHIETLHVHQYSLFLLCILIGSGVQVVLASVDRIIVFCASGPQAREVFLPKSLATAYLSYSVVGGYLAAMYYNQFGGLYWKSNAFAAASLLPGLSLCVHILMCAASLNTVLPTPTEAFITASIFILISIALSLPGVLLFKFQTRNANAPSAMTAPIHSRVTFPTVGPLTTALVPVLCLASPACLVFDSIWSYAIYEHFGLVLLYIVSVLCITSVTLNLTLCYLNVSTGHPNWCWIPFRSSAFLAFYMLVYSAWYFLKFSGSLDFDAHIAYFGYTSVILLVLFAGYGSVGFLFCDWFIHRLYKRMDSSQESQVFVIPVPQNNVK